MSNPSYSSSSGGSGASFAPDRMWGTIFIVLYALMLIVALLIILGVSSVFALAGSSGQHSGPNLAPFFGVAFAAVAGIIVLVSLGVHIVGAVGIHRSLAWGFWVTIIVSVISLGSSGGGTCLTIGPLVYSILRLSGGYGPKPA